MSELPAALTALAISGAFLGLAAGSVDVREHDPRWGQVYPSVEQHLLNAVDDLGASVEHIGSTSVAGLAAKPILDIAIGAPAPIDTSAYVTRLEPAGFDFQADLGMYGGLLFHAHAESGHVVAHIHVVDIDDFQWRWYLTFRDALRSDDGLRAQYQALKQQSAAEHAHDREQYTQAKFDWILNTVQSLDQTKR